MLDRFNRKINYLRISITDRCNLRCTYCMPECGVDLISHKKVLTFEEITEIARTGVKLGIDKVRITGGEPLVRRGVVDLVKMISEIPGILDFSLTTNGTLLNQFAESLAKAGLHRVNISLDTLNPDRYKEITRIGDINSVLKGIRCSQKSWIKSNKNQLCNQRITIGKGRSRSCCILQKK